MYVQVIYYLCEYINSLKWKCWIGSICICDFDLWCREVVPVTYPSNMLVLHNFLMTPYYSVSGITILCLIFLLFVNIGIVSLPTFILLSKP